jgi:CRISPR/Cas system-associated protein Cas5 (RAMP superfamily)
VLVVALPFPLRVDTLQDAHICPPMTISGLVQPGYVLGADMPIASSIYTRVDSIARMESMYFIEKNIKEKLDYMIYNTIISKKSNDFSKMYVQCISDIEIKF